MAGVRRARRFWSASATWTRATGAPICRAAPSSNTGCLWVVGLASLMAIFLQVIAARLGVVTGKDLAQCCRDWYPRWTRWPNWLMCEVAIVACDLAEVLGGAVALNLLFHIPIFWAVIITGVGRAAAAGVAAVRHADHRGHRAAAGGDHRRLLLHRNFRPAADAAQLSGNGAGDDHARAFARRA